MLMGLGCGELTSHYAVMCYCWDIALVNGKMLSWQITNYDLCFAVIIYYHKTDKTSFAMAPHTNLGAFQYGFC